jgi:hypothetical protein
LLCRLVRRDLAIDRSTWRFYPRAPIVSSGHYQHGRGMDAGRRRWSRLV